MLNDLTCQQQALATFMSDVSERCYYAGWLQNLEYVLWNAVLHGPRQYGHDTITADDIAKLKDLATAADAWIIFDDKEEETPVELVN